MRTPAETSATAQATTVGEAGDVDGALLQAGFEAYNGTCAGCHQAGGVGLVMTDADVPIAYFLAREILGTAEVLNLAVVPGFRGRGLGAELLDAGLAAVRKRGGTEVFLEVRASNAVAQSLYAGRGFRTEGRRRGYYRRPDEDALVLRLLMAPVRLNDGDGGPLV